MYDMAFAGSQVGLACGNNEMFRTTDGGATWQNVPGFFGGSWYHIRFVDATTCFAGANGALAKSTDAGATWTEQSLYPECPIIYGMSFKDANTGFVCGYQISSGLAGLFKTTDGGQTWQLKHEGSTNSVLYLSPTKLIADNGYDVIGSVDGGERWFTLSTVSTGIQDIAKLDESTLVGVSEAGDIWRSTDAGSTWSERRVGQGDLPDTWRVYFFDNLNGQVAGPNWILGTTDGGLTWTQESQGIGADWNGIAAFSDSRVYLAGFHGYVQMTNDSGLHWNTQILDPPIFGRDTSFSDIAVTGPSSAYAVGHWGSMFKTLDSGATWINLSNSVNPSYYANAVSFMDANNGWVVGWDYNSSAPSYLRRTHDGGFTWQPSITDVTGIDVDFIGQTGYVLSPTQPLWKTTDDGATWTPLTVSTPTYASSMYSMSWYSASEGYVAAMGGIFHTTDGGLSWSLGAYRGEWPSFIYMDVKTGAPNEVWACGATQGGGNAVVLKSLDSGVTWRTWPLPGQYAVPYKIAITDNFVYVAGYQGDTYRFNRRSVVTGTVTLGNYLGPIAGTQLTVEVRNPGSTIPLDTYTTTLDAAGQYAISTNRQGTFDVAVKATHWLRKVAHNVVLGLDGANNVNLALINGDANGDNSVGLSDFAALRQALGSMPGSPNWNPNADFDGNGSVGLGDYSILRLGFGKVGDS